MSGLIPALRAQMTTEKLALPAEKLEEALIASNHKQFGHDLLAKIFTIVQQEQQKPQEQQQFIDPVSVHRMILESMSADLIKQILKGTPKSNALLQFKVEEMMQAAKL